MLTRMTRGLTLGLVLLGLIVGIITLSRHSKSAWSEDGPYWGRKDEHHKPGDDFQGVKSKETTQKHSKADATAATMSSSIVENQDTGPTGIVELRFMGRLGNNLFEYAAARSLAERKGWALFLRTARARPVKYGTLLREEGMACFPGIRNLGPSTDSLEMKELASTNFRGLRNELADSSPRRVIMEDWFQDYSLFSHDADHLREVMALNPSCCGKASPGSNDLVIHFRNYRAELNDKQYNKLFFKDLDFRFYDQVILDLTESTQGLPETIWVVGEFKKETHPLMKHLREVHDNVRKAEDVKGQFQALCYLSRAPRLVMAQSTFSWWGAFLGNASEIHFPLYPRGGGVTVPRIMVKNDLRYVYRNSNGAVVRGP